METKHAKEVRGYRNKVAELEARRFEVVIVVESSGEVVNMS
jgi:hypothetical protein